METINSTDFRIHVAQYLAAAENGEPIIIMRHGKPIAKLLPISTADKLASWQQPALKLKIKGVSLSKAIIKDRRESSR